VNGVATGAGMNLALGADLRIASDKAVFGQVFVKRGLHPDWGGTYFLTRLVGLSKALELIFFGELVPAEEALRIGLVNRVVPDAEFGAAVRDWAEALAAGPPISLRLAKRGVYRNLQADLASALEYETYAQQIVWQSEDAGEGIRAFVEKRPPRFQGR
jgi:2-(1,2-epoxy-1,2-dihydrophenyl)acetyl-CoA isomerase